MKITKMWLDGKPNQSPLTTTRANRNFLFNKELGCLTNEDGNLLVDTYGEQKKLIGVITLDSNDFIVFVKKAENHSEIGYVDSNLIYTTLISNGQLNFQYDSPIHGEFQRNQKGELIITYKDSQGVLKYFNTSKPIDFDNMTAFPDGKRPDLKSSIDIGGSLKAGAWYPIIQYEKEDYVTTSWIKDYNPIYITNVTINPQDARQFIEGTIPNAETNKLIRFTISNLDLRFKRLKIGVVFQHNNTRDYFYSKTINIVSPTEVVTIARMDELTAITPDEVIIDRNKFKVVKHLTQLENVLYLGDLEKYQEPIQQKLINNVRFKFKSTLIDMSPVNYDPTFKDHSINNQRRHFQHGEVYAMYIRLEYRWGFGQWWHSPGRELTADDRSEGIDGFKKYQAYDTCSVDGTLGAWENEDENYPTDGNYPQGKVRHIKTPSIAWMKSNVYNGDDYYGSRKLDILNLQLDLSTFNLGDFKDSEGNPAINYQVGYARRDVNTGLVAGQSIFVGGLDFFGSPSTDAETIFTSMGINLRTSNFNQSALSTVNIRTYDFNMLFTKQVPFINYVRSEVVLRASTRINNYVNDNAYNNLRYTIPQFFAGIATPAPRLLTKVNQARFIISNTNLDIINNVMLEDNINLALTQSLDLPDIPNRNGADWGTPTIYTHLLTMLAIKKNCYISFYNQPIIICDEDKANNIYGGDTYFTLQNLNTFGTTGHNTYSNDPTQTDNANTPQNGLRVASMYVAESRFNMDFRYVNPAAEGNTYHAYYSNPDVYLPRMVRDKEPNQISLGYNTDYNAQNDLTYSDVYNPNNELTPRDKYAITRSSPIATETNNINSWLNFKINDIYYLDKTRGELVFLGAGKDYLIIHHHNALFRTRTRTYIDTTGEAAFTGSGDIFDNPPEEVLYDKQGALGTQHRWSCHISKYGYFWWDSEAGKFYQYVGQVKELSGNGLNNFFLKNSECYDDNPFNNYGIHTVVDTANKRLLVTKKNIKLKDEYKKRFRGIWKSDQNFINSLRNGDIVVKDGQLVIVN